MLPRSVFKPSANMKSLFLLETGRSKDEITLVETSRWDECYMKLSPNKTSRGRGANCILLGMSRAASHEHTLFA